MKIITAFVFCFISYCSYSQFILKGNVSDEGGSPLPGARVSVVNTTYGVPTNMNGEYYLEFDTSDRIVIQFEMIGFEPFVDTIYFKTSSVVLNVTLQEKAVALNTVEIYADKKDIAKEVIQKVIDNKKSLANQYTSYQCETYVKTSLEKEARFKKMSIATESDTSKEQKKKMNFIETYSITQFLQKDHYKETVLAHNDYTEKSNSSVTVTADFTDPDNIIPSQTIAYNPYIFFEKVQDGDFDLYQNLIELPKITDDPLVSPLALNTFLNYKFHLNTIIIENGQKIYDIGVQPRFKSAPLFTGNLYIIDSLWVIKSMDLSINKNVMNYFQDFRIIQDFDQVDNNWVPVRREFIYAINDVGEVIVANTRVNHKNYQFNPTFSDRAFKNVQMVYEDDAFDKDSTYWAKARPIQLKPEELQFIHEQDSITKVQTSDAYIDSVNTAYNKIRFWDLILSGVGFRNRIKQQEIYIKPLIEQVQLIGVGGYRHRLGGFYSKEFKNAQKIKLNGDIDYGFRNKDIKGQVSVEYTYLPKRFGRFKIGGGDIYDYVTMEQSIIDFFGVSNQVRKTLFEFSNRLEITNGLYGEIGFDYSVRRDISNLDYAPWVNDLIDQGIWSLPTPYETYTVSILKFDLAYRFRQQYIIKGNKKLIIGTEYPELTLKFRKGIPTLFNSDVNFNFVEVGISDKVTLGTMGVLKWNAEAGSFFGKNLKEVQFVERKFIRGSDQFFFSNPLETVQLLATTFNTTFPYFQAFAIHHFNGAIMNKIPLINRLKLALVAGGSLLLIQDENYSHAELYAGIERPFKIKRQLFKISAFYVVKENNTQAVTLNFKLGLDFYNSFTNNWSY